MMADADFNPEEAIASTQTVVDNFDRLTDLALESYINLDMELKQVLKRCLPLHPPKEAYAINSMQNKFAANWGSAPPVWGVGATCLLAFLGKQGLTSCMEFKELNPDKLYVSEAAKALIRAGTNALQHTTADSSSAIDLPHIGQIELISKPGLAHLSHSDKSEIMPTEKDMRAAAVRLISGQIEPLIAQGNKACSHNAVIASLFALNGSTEVLLFYQFSLSRGKTALPETFTTKWRATMERRTVPFPTRAREITALLPSLQADIQLYDRLEKLSAAGDGNKKKWSWGNDDGNTSTDDRPWEQKKKRPYVAPSSSDNGQGRGPFAIGAAITNEPPRTDGNDVCLKFLIGTCQDGQCRRAHTSDVVTILNSLQHLLATTRSRPMFDFCRSVICRLSSSLGEQNSSVLLQIPFSASNNLGQQHAHSNHFSHGVNSNMAAAVARQNANANTNGPYGVFNGQQQSYAAPPQQYQHALTNGTLDGSQVLPLPQGAAPQAVSKAAGQQLQAAMGAGQ
jgi:hypothetical protein